MIFSRSNTEFENYYSTSARLSFIRFSSALLFAVVAVRLIYVQGILRTDLREKAERQLPSEMTYKAPRWRILDRRRLSLAESVQVQSCYVDPTMLGNKPKTADILAQTFDLNSHDLLKKIRETKGSFLWIKRDVPLLAVNALKAKKILGVGFKSESRRHYPLGPLASHAMGLVGFDGRGLSGVEASFDSSLSIKKALVPSSKPLPPGDVVLTIDSGIQQIVERELQWGVNKTGAKKGMAIVQDPWTGEILAMASVPSLSLDPDKPPLADELRIPPVVDVFEPGSTFKIVAAAGAIEEKLVVPGEQFSGEKGAMKLAGGLTIHDHEPRQSMTFDDIWTYSSNIGASKIGERLGSGRLYQYARLFGFGVFPGSGLPGEAKGFLRPLSQWSGVSKNVVSFGQEVSVTALQLVGAYSTIANGGRLMEPTLVKGIVSETGDFLWKDNPTEVRRVITKSTADRLTQILVRVVEKGTGQYAQLRWGNQKVAGKTGTAQKFDNKDRRYHSELTLVSFCGFFPADKPAYTMLIVLDEPEGQRWGGVDAAPIFRRIAEQILPAKASPGKGEH